jgi:multiple sugar transport system substrate-binding protein
MKKIGFLLLILILPAMLFAGGGGRQDANYLRFAWWGNPTRDARTNEVIALFMQRNAGVTVEAEAAGWDGYWDRMNTLAAAGNLPDIMQQDVNWILQFHQRNQLANMQPFVDSGEIDLSMWPEVGISPGRIDGRLVGLVLGTNTWGLAVDPGVLQRAGVTFDDTTWTWADYERIALQVYRTTNVQTANLNLPFTMEHIARQFGSTLYARDGRSLGIAGHTAAMQAVRGWLEMELRLEAAGALYDPEDAFVLGRAMDEGMLARGQVWNTPYWSNQHIAHVNAANRPLSYVMYPTVAGNRAPFGNYLRASMYMSMIETAQNKPLAARFINFFANDLGANRILQGERGVPIPTNVRADLYARLDDLNREVFDFVDRVTPRASPMDPFYPGRAGEVENTMRPIHLQILTRRVSLDAGFNQLLSAAAAVLTRP